MYWISIYFTKCVEYIRHLKRNLPLYSKLSKKARIAKILPELRSSSLLSLGQLCDDDCDILLNKKKMYVIKDKELILQGTRNKLDGLWDIPVYKTELNSDNFGKPPTSAALYIEQDNRTGTLINKPAAIKEKQVKHQHTTHSPLNSKI